MSLRQVKDDHLVVDKLEAMIATATGMGVGGVDLDTLRHLVDDPDHFDEVSEAIRQARHR